MRFSTVYTASAFSILVQSSSVFAGHAGMSDLLTSSTMSQSYSNLNTDLLSISSFIEVYKMMDLFIKVAEKPTFHNYSF